MSSAGRTISIRVPEGLPEELRAATGLPFGTLVRFTMVAYLERLRIERKLKEGETFLNAKTKAARDIQQIVNEHCDEMESENEHDNS